FSQYCLHQVFCSANNFMMSLRLLPSGRVRHSKLSYGTGHSMVETLLAVVTTAAEQVLADQVLDDHSRLGKLDLAAIGEKRVGTAGLQADKLAAEKPGSQDARIRIVRNLVVPVVDCKRDNGVKLLRIELHRPHTANSDTRH